MASITMTDSACLIITCLCGQQQKSRYNQLVDRAANGARFGTVRGDKHVGSSHDSKRKADFFHAGSSHDSKGEVDFVLGDKQSGNSVSTDSVS